MSTQGEKTKEVRQESEATTYSVQPNSNLRRIELEGMFSAIDRSQAIIEFDLKGNILSANTNFLSLLGYSAGEVVGKHHRIFCDPDYVKTAEYSAFWAKLGAGQFDAGEYKRICKDGSEVWIQATYNPIFDDAGKPFKVMKFASDVTTVKMTTAETVGKMTAVDRAQAVIEFDLRGKILTANDNFLNLLGYKLKDVAGKHHRMFCDPDYIKTHEYEEFWDRLGSGEYESGEYKRFGNGGKEVWIQATYNPIFDADGKPFKVVKFASDVTEAKLVNAEIASRVAAMDRAQAVIEFNLDGTVIKANPNFLDLLGYTEAEIVGKHHRIFCDPDFTNTPEYANFWDRLSKGQFEAGEYKRLGKGGKEVWIQATYNPILDLEGRPVKVVKFASDVTDAKLSNAEIASRMSAVDRAQAVIEFDLEGYVIDANENFLRTMGYSLRELVGQHHSMFCSDDYTRSEEYRDFWLRLSKGEFISGRFHRVGKFNRDVYIQAAYNPIFDLNGNPVKVVKYAYDVTPSVEREQRIASGTQEMTIAIENLATSIDAISTGSSQATELAATTHGSANEGAKALRSSIEAIALIERSSRSIAEIVRTMSDIASETNLLAFNASIEAARAGEHGVGFSIVANEVRKLAERSSEAAAQIAALVEESAGRVSRGAEVCNEANDSFEGIAESISQTGDVVGSISAALEVQQKAFSEVNAIVGKLVSANAN